MSLTYEHLKEEVRLLPPLGFLDTGTFKLAFRLLKYFTWENRPDATKVEEMNRLLETIRFRSKLSKLSTEGMVVRWARVVLAKVDQNPKYAVKVITDTIYPTFNFYCEDRHCTSVGLTLQDDNDTENLTYILTVDTGRPRVQLATFASKRKFCTD